jgi:hypothetical protein
MTTIPAASFSQYVLAVHIAAVVVAFGVTFAYPIIFGLGARMDPRHMGWFHRVEEQVGKRLITPGLVVVLVGGIYLASHEHVWSEFYVQWGLGAAIVLGGLGGAFFAPTERRLAALADRDIAAAGDGPVNFSEEYRALSRRLMTLGGLSSLLVLVTIVIMTAKP